MSMLDLFPKEAYDHVLESIIETAIDGILLIDPRGTVLMVNSAVTKLFGYSSDELLGQNVSMLMPSPDRENHDNYIDNYRQSRVPKIIGIGREVQGQRKDGSLFPARLAVSEVMIGDKQFFYRYPAGYYRDESVPAKDSQPESGIEAKCDGKNH